MNTAANKNIRNHKKYLVQLAKNDKVLTYNLTLMQNQSKSILPFTSFSRLKGAWDITDRDQKAYL